MICSRRFYIHCERCGVSFFVSNPKFFCHLLFRLLVDLLIFVLLVDDICTLATIVIVEPTPTYLVSSAGLACGVATTLTALLKEGFYCDCYPVDVFLLAIEIFGCLHQ